MAAFLAAILAMLAPLAGARAEGPPDISADLLEAVFPAADRVGEPEGLPIVRPVFLGPQHLGYVFSTREVSGTLGYGGKPFDILVGLDLTGHITGAYIREHHEPILIIGISNQNLHDFVAQFRNIDVRQTLDIAGARGNGAALDGISGATISSLVMSDAILRSARIVARAHGILAPPGGRGGLDLDGFAPADWATLKAEGAVGHLHLTRADVDRAFTKLGIASVPIGKPDDTFIDLYAALATPAGIGRNLLGAPDFNRFRAGLPVGGHLLFVGGWGAYSFKGTRYVRSGVFDRLRLVQGAKTIALQKDWHTGLESIPLEDADPLREIALFAIPPDAGFDAARPWRLDLSIARKDATGAEVRADFQLPYEVPKRFLLNSESAADIGWIGFALSEDAPLWLRNWLDHPVRIAVLLVMLVILTAILFLEDFVASMPRRLEGLRMVFLAFTLVWLGWYAGAQLSVINVLTFVHALMADFRWEFFLLDPLIFILWSFVAVTLLFWGRGVYCGWLCPFGALQEISNHAARALRVPQLSLPFGLNERLWPIKYVLFLILLALSLNSMSLAVTGAEVEPFKTAISMKFMRAWPFVLFVAVLLFAGLFIERFYCRYLCPLGAALAIPSRQHMFEWLKRRKQCGSECSICAVRCTVQAIHPSGLINPSECIYCLKCQAHYFDDTLCPPLIARRKRRERRRASAEAHALTAAGD